MFSLAYLPLIMSGDSLPILEISYLFNCCDTIPGNSNQINKKKRRERGVGEGRRDEDWFSFGL